MSASPRPCGMCLHLCHRCQDRFDRLRAEWEAQETRVATLDLAFAEADDTERDEIAERLQDATEAWWELGEALTAMEDGEYV